MNTKNGCGGLAVAMCLLGLNIVPGLANAGAVVSTPFDIEISSYPFVTGTAHQSVSANTTASVTTNAKMSHSSLQAMRLATCNRVFMRLQRTVRKGVERQQVLICCSEDSVLPASDGGQSVQHASAARPGSAAPPPRATACRHGP